MLSCVATISTHWLANLIELLVANFTLTDVRFDARTVGRTLLHTDGQTGAILQLVVIEAATFFRRQTFAVCSTTL